MGSNAFARAFDAALAARPVATLLYARGCADARDASAEVTWARLDALAARLEAPLAAGAATCDAGTFVPVCLESGAVFAACVLAAARTGLALVTLNPRMSDAERALRLGALSDALGCTFPRVPGEDELAAAADGACAAEGRGGARHASHAAPGDACAVVMFTSGTTGVPKAVPLSWDNLCDAAMAANECLGCGPTDGALWQAALPMCHVGGLQMLVRSVLAGRPLALYRRFRAHEVLADALELGATHLSVVDKTLRDLLDADEERAARGQRRVLPAYRCLLLGGSAPNRATLERAVRMGASVQASYGMTETASLMACVPVRAGFDGWLELLGGYRASIGEGGALAVSGPGVTRGYLNAPTPHDERGLLLTGDAAEVDASGARLRVRERTGDMFVSGGENVYPAEIEDALRALPGVRDAYVYGARDETWGRRPVAFVETGLAAGEVREALGGHLSRLTMPQRLYALGELPRMGIGKVDRSRLREADERRIEIRRVELFWVEQPLRTPFVTAKVDLRTRASVLVRVTDHAGRTGLGECVAFETPWYLPETLGDDLEVLTRELAPAVLGRPFLDAREVAPALRKACPRARELPMALGALEPALWDVWAQARELPLWRVLREAAGTGEGPCAGDGGSGGPAAVPCGVVVGIADIATTLETVARHVSAGYVRVKLKVRPGDDVARVRAVRDAYPDLMLTLDANQSYGPGDVHALRDLDELGIACIEEPLAPLPGEGADELWGRLEALQRELRTPVCLDESFRSGKEALRALRSHSGLRCFAMKVAKFGGVGPALEFWREARDRGVALWVGGMYETSISKRMHAAFETLPGMDIPGDISATSRYFARDVARPELATPGGSLVLNDSGRPWGLGCALDEDALAQVCTRRWVFER